MDKRLVRRLEAMRAAASPSPTATFPSMFPERKALDGAYSFFSNDDVDPDGVLADHTAETVARCGELGEVLVLSDTTDVSFGGEKRRGLSHVGRGGQGFMLHTSLAVSGPETRRVLGVINTEFWVRPELTRRERKQTRQEILNDPANESLVWMDGVRRSEAALAGRARTIHVMDAAADGYNELAELEELGVRAVIRASHDRTVVNGEKNARLFDVLAEAEPLVQRDVPISARKKSPMPDKVHVPRASRLARLHITATPVTIQRSSRASSEWPKTVSLTVVHVIEYEPPEGTVPVEWILLTNLPVLTPADAARVVDIYRVRWVIEEFFKALKTGCAVEKRQLEEADALMNMTAFFIPIAAKILDMRNHGREFPDAPASQVCTPEELKVIDRIGVRRLPKKPTVEDAMLAVAKLGGHLKNNGAPGWLVLARGWAKVVEFMTLNRRFNERERCPVS